MVMDKKIILKGLIIIHYLYYICVLGAQGRL